MTKCIVAILTFILTYNSLAFFGKKEMKQTSQAEYDMDKAIPRNDISKGKNILRKYDVKNPNLFAKFFDHATIKKANLKSVNSNSFYRYKRTKAYCRPEIVQMLIQAGGKPSHHHIKGILANSCQKSLEAVLNAISPKVWLITLRNYEVHLDFSEQFQTRLGKTLQPLIKNLSAGCKSTQKASCEAKDALASKLKDYEKQYRHNKFLKTNKGKRWKDEQQICDHYRKSQYYKSLASEEKERGKVSGFVNATQMKKWGDYAYRYKKNFNKSKNSYEDKFNLKFKPSSCKK